jgi:hypothetical protein
MTLNKSIWILFVLALLFGGGLTACRFTTTKQTGGEPMPANSVLTGTPLPAARSTRWVDDFSELPKGAVSHIEVVYFHRTERCESCLNAENYTRETLDKYFADQLKNGLISLQVLDVEKPENAALVQKFDAAGSALYLSVLIQGTEYLCPNPDIWFYTSNKYLFVDTLRKKLTSLVGGP